MTKSCCLLILVVAILIAAATFAGCAGNTATAPSSPETPAASDTLTITDGYGRTVTIPADPDQIICSGAGCLRYVVYLGAQDRVVGVDSIEKEKQTPEGRAYAIANPQFADLPLIGEFRGKDDPEKIVGIGPQVIFKAGGPTDQPGMVIAAADTLQNKTGIPVISFPYGSLRNAEEKTQMYSSLRLMGSILDREARAEDLIAYTDATIADLEKRTGDIAAADKKTAYIGGVSFAGAHGIISTEPAYPPFIWVNVQNIAEGSGTQHADISKETLVSSDPEFIFIDVGTTQIEGTGAISELKTNPAYADLAAVKAGNVYGVLPYNFYTTNYDSVLADAYYVGTVVYPDRFSDVDARAKADEIYTKFVTEPVFATINGNYGDLGFTQITI